MMTDKTQEELAEYIYEATRLLDKASVGKQHLTTKSVTEKSLYETA